MKHLNSLRLPSLGRRVLPFPRNTHWKMCEALVRNGQGYRSKARYQVFFAWMELVQDRLLLLFSVGSQKKIFALKSHNVAQKIVKTCHMPTLFLPSFWTTPLNWQPSFSKPIREHLRPRWNFGGFSPFTASLTPRGLIRIRRLNSLW